MGPRGSGTARAVSLVDLDGDRSRDVVFLRDGSPVIWRSDGHGGFTEVTATWLPTTSSAWIDLAVGDVDGDGDPDLFGHDERGGNGTGYALLLRNDGAGHFVDLSSMQLPRVAQTVSGVALGDLDGDGDLDVLLATGGTVSPPLLYDNDGTGVFRDLTATRIAPGTVGAAHRFLLADLDGDGDLDVLVDAPYPGTLRNDGTGSFSPWQTLPGFAEFLGNGVPASTAAVGDVDLVFGRTQRFPSPWGWMSCMRNDGTGVFNWLGSTHWGSGRVPTSLCLGDVDGDGDLDVAAGGSRAELYVNDGNGAFQDVSTRLEAADGETWTNAFGDLDLDGDLDLFLGGVRGNLLRHLDTPATVQRGQAWILDAYARFGTASSTDVALPFLGFAPASIRLPIGTIGVDPSLLVTLPPITIPQPSGVASLPLTVPGDPALAGLSIVTQAVFVHSVHHVQIGNVTASTIR